MADQIEYWDDPDLCGFAVTIGRKYRSFVDQDDVKHEMVLWCLEDEARAAKLWASPWWFKARRLVTVAERYCRTQKALAVGFELDDEVYYSPGLIRKLLPDAFDHEALPPVNGKAEVKPRSSGPGLEWETMMADLRAALEKLPQDDFDLLWAVYGQTGGTVSGYATVRGWGYRKALRAERRAIDRLVATLGGHDPWVADRDWEPPKTASEPRTDDKTGVLV